MPKDKALSHTECADESQRLLHTYQYVKGG